MSKQYIKASNESPKLQLGTIGFWFLFIKYFELPEWTLGVWVVLAATLITTFIYRLATEEGIDVVKR